MLFWLFFALGAAAVASSSSSSSTGAGPLPAPPAGPLTSSDELGAYLRRIQVEEDAIAAKRGADEADSQEKIDQIKSFAKYIPILGSAWTSIVDLGAWLGHVLGSAYRDENRQEDIDALTLEVGKYLRAGWIPPNPTFHFSGKVGARSFAEELAQQRSNAENLSTRRAAGFFFDEGELSTAAIRAVGALTLKWGSDPRLAPSLAAIGNDQGTLFASTAKGQLVAPMLIGTLVALEAGHDVATTQAAAVDAWNAELLAERTPGAKNPNAIPSPHGDVAPFPVEGDSGLKQQARIADVFLRVLRDVSHAPLIAFAR